MLFSCPYDDLHSDVSSSEEQRSRRWANLVFDISNVLYKVDVVTEIIPQNSSDDVLRQVVPGMSHMSRIVDGRTTIVPVDLTALERYKFVLYVVGQTSAGPLSGFQAIAHHMVSMTYLRSGERIVNSQDWLVNYRLRSHPFRLSYFGSGCHTSR
jgi:hypothetical protein